MNNTSKMNEDHNQKVLNIHHNIHYNKPNADGLETEEAYP
jgi:hypothetical protein